MTEQHTKPVYIGNSRDGRANRWRVTCPKCQHEWIPTETMMARQVLTCPKRRCWSEMVADYNAETVTLLESK